MSSIGGAERYIIVGKMGSTYGIHGWLKITSFTQSIETILEYPHWYLSSQNGWQKIQIESGKKHGKGLIVKITGLTTPEQARLLTGKNIAVLRTQLPPTQKNEYYWADLIGLDVFNVADKKLGTVRYLMETGANDVVVIADEHQREHAIPWLFKSVIKIVSLEDKKLVVDWELI